jgi:predicted O-methyltransferase YrrM
MRPASDPAIRVKRVLRSLLGEQIIGMIDYIRFPERSAGFGGPFNGQPARQALFHEIITHMRPQGIVETGTYLGTTTDFMAQTGLPIFTIETDRRRYGFVRARFMLGRHNVNPLHGDSRAVLRNLFDGPLSELSSRTLFFYLDAHWNDDLPLVEEIDIVFSRCPSAIVVIDDFQVPFDAGYGYDDYGPGKALAPQYIAPAVSAHRLQAFFPSTPSADEGNGIYCPPSGEVEPCP